MELKKITEQITDGSHNPPKATQEKNNYPMISAKNINNGIIDFNEVRPLSKEDFEKENKRTNAKYGDVLLTIVGAIGRVAVIETDKKMAFQRSVCVIKPYNNIINSKYLKYVLESQNLQEQIRKNANGAAQKGIYLKQVEKLKIPVPSLEVQEKIVRILDKFDKLTNDISEGLPAEIEARQKQYEHYRNKLLSFKELKTA